MSLDKKEIISAQVILRAASGKRVEATTPITADNIHDYTPSAEAAARVGGAFAALGFQTGPVVGNSFAITAPAGRFEQTFGVQLRRQAGRGVEALQAGGSAGYELPLTKLSSGVAGLIEAVTFTPPPDFGPANFGP